MTEKSANFKNIKKMSQYGEISKSGLPADFLNINCWEIIFFL